MFPNLFLLAVTGLAVSAAADNTPFFRNDYTYLKEFNTFFKFHTSKMSFSDAVYFCKAEGSELYLPSTEEESRAVFTLSARKDAQLVWIGVHDLFGESSFTTLTGVPLDDIYSNWGPGEPNNVNKEEHCVVLKNDATYNDVKCSDSNHFVCTSPVRNLPKNDNCQTHDKDYHYRVELDSCYKLHTTPTIWQDAFKTCRGEQSHLVIINNDFEAKYLVSLMNAHPVHKLPGTFNKQIIHVGFNDLINNGIYKTIDGKLVSESSYTKWASGQPDDYQGVERCGSIFRDGFLNDVSCDERAMFVCEKDLTPDYQDFQWPAEEITTRKAEVSVAPVDHQVLMPTTSTHVEIDKAQFSVPGALVPLPDA